MSQYDFPKGIKLLTGWQIAPKPIPSANYLVWPVFRQTLRKTKPIGYLYFADRDRHYPDNLEPNFILCLLSLFKKNKKRSQESILLYLKENSGIPEKLLINLLEDALMQGWLMKWVRVKSEGETVVSQEWLPGHVLEEAIRLGQVPGSGEGHSWLNNQKEQLIQLWAKPAKGLSPIQETFLKRLLPYIEQHLGTVEDYLKKDSLEPPYIHNFKDWTFNPANVDSNYCLTIDFLSSLAHAITYYPYGFDWREIGSISKGLFGQSNRFDHLRDSLEVVVDSLFQEELSSLGLLSPGSIYSIYVAGNLSIHYNDGWVDSWLRPGVYSLNNLQLEEISNITHRAKYMLITNNRAILLKMYKSGFIKAYPGLLVVALEEKLRKAHTNLLEFIRGGDCKILIWLDNNPDAALMAKQINRILPRARYILSHRNQKKEALYYNDWLDWLSKNPHYQEDGQEFLIGEPTNWLQLLN